MLLWDATVQRDEQGMDLNTDQLNGLVDLPVSVNMVRSSSVVEMIMRCTAP